MNDVFGWGIADSEMIWLKEVAALAELYAKHGCEADIAWVAVLRGYDAENMLEQSDHRDFDKNKYYIVKKIIASDIDKYYWMDMRKEIPIKDS